MSTVTLIQPSTVQRDPETGYWAHPDLPNFDEGQIAEYKMWIEAQGLETTWTRMESDLDCNHPAYVAYWDEGEGTCALWTPEPPEGEGWFTLWIDDTDDGPMWIWARRVIDDRVPHEAEALGDKGRSEHANQA